jgi:hypothetical protein
MTAQLCGLARDRAGLERVNGQGAGALYVSGPQPDRPSRQENLMLKKVLATLIASAFAATVFAQAQPAQPKGQTGTETQKAEPATPVKKQAKAQKKDRTHKPTAKAKAKANGETKSESKSETKK